MTMNLASPIPARMPVAPSSMPAEISELGAYIAQGGPMAAVLGMDEEEMEALYTVAHHALLQGQHEEAALLFGRLALLDAMSPRYRWGLALALRERGQHADALVHLGICCQLEPDRPEALIEMARSLLVVGEGDIAREALAVALSLCTTTQHEAARGRAQALLDLVSQPDAAARRSANQGDSE